MTDRLTLTRALEGSGMQSAAAERIATEIYDAIHDNVATKADLELLRTELRADLASLKSDLSTMEARLDHKITLMTNRLVAVVVVIVTLLFGALHLWPVH